MMSTWEAGFWYYNYRNLLGVFIESCNNKNVKYEIVKQHSGITTSSFTFKIRGKTKDIHDIHNWIINLR